MPKTKNQSREIVFIDPAVGDIDTLIKGLRPEVAALRLDACAPAPAQIARALVGQGRFDAIHIIAHGAAGELRFAAGPLSLDTIDEHRADLAAVGRSLSDDGDLLLWACGAGQCGRGAAFVDALARATGAEVGAASGIVGAATRGGHWTLDAHQPATPALSPLTSRGQAAYPGVLATSTTVNDNNTTATEDITTTTTNATINLNNSGGDDTVDADDSGNVTVNGNNSAGDDCIAITGAGAATVNLNNSTGNDDVLIAAATVNATVNDNNSGIPGGTDHIDITGATVAATVNLNNSVGNDDVTVAGTNSTKATVNLNNSTGTDNISIGSMTGATTATVNLNNSTGTDIIHVLGATTTATVNLTNSTGKGDMVMLVGGGTGTINATNSTGNDTLIGGNTTNTITGGSGADTEDLMGGGTLYAGSGNDLGIYTLSDHYGMNSGADYYYGQGGTNTLEIVLTSGQAGDATVAAAIAGYNAFLATHPGVNQTYTFNFGGGTGALTVAGWQILDVDITGTTLTPVIAVPGTQLLGIGHAGAISGVSLSESDNFSGESFTVTLTDAAGDLSANTLAPGGGGTITGSGTTSFTITGSLSQVNSDLATLQDSDPAASSDTITVKAIDSLGNTAGSQTIAINSCLYIAQDTATLTPVHTLIGSAGAGTVEFVVSGLDGAGTGTLTLSDGSATTTVSVTNNGTYTADLSGSAWADGPVGSSLTFLDSSETAYFAATGNAVTLDRDTGETVALAIGNTSIGSAAAGAVAFTVSGEDVPDDSGSVVFSDGTHAVTVALSAGQTLGTANLSTLNDGPISSSLSLTDAAGNSFAATGNAVTLDRDTGETVALAIGNTSIGSAAAGAVAFTVSGEDVPDDSGSVVFSDGTHAVTVALSAGQTLGTANLSTLNDGPISSSLSLTDAAGNSFAATGNAVTLDRDTGETVALAIGNTSIGSAAAGAVAFTVSGEDVPDDSGSVVFSDGTHAVTVALSAGQTLGTANLSTLNDGPISSSLSLTDAAGNSFAATGNAVTLDRDTGETVALAIGNTSIGSAAAGAVAFTVSGEDVPDDSGSVVFSDGTHAVTVALSAGQTLGTANLSTLNDGPISSSLSLTDAAGNSFAATGNAVTLDRDTGETVALAIGNTSIGSAAAGAVAFTVSGEDVPDDSGSVVFSDGTHAVTVALSAGQTLGTANLSTLNDGPISSSLSLTDAAGNSFAATGNAVTLDRDTGETVALAIGNTSIGSAAAGAVAFTVSGEDVPDDSGSVVFSDGTHAVTVALSAGQTLGTANLSTLNDGPISSSLSLTDAAGNSFAATGNAVTLDQDVGEQATLALASTTIGSAGAGAVTFSITGLDAGDTGGAGNTGTVSFVEGTQTVTVGVTGDGTYSANLSSGLNDGTVATSLTFTDAAGNHFTASGPSVTLDRDPGQTATLAPVAVLVGSASAAAVSFVVSGLDETAGGTGTLTLSDGALTTTIAVPGDGTYSANLSGSTWTDGAVNSTLTFTDAAGNSFTASGTAVILDKDTGEAATLAVSPTTETIGAATATFTISGLDAGDTGAGNTATLVISETGQPTETFSLTPTATSGTYTEILGFTATGTATAALTVTDSAGNHFTAANETVTLVATNPMLTSVTANSGSNNYTSVTGDVADGVTGTITLTLVDPTAGFTTTTTVVETTANTPVAFTIAITTNKNDTITLTAHEALGGTATVSGKHGPLTPAGIAGSPINLALTDPGVGETVTVTVADVPSGWSLNAGSDTGNGTWTVQTTDPSSLYVTTPATFAGAEVLNVSESWTNPDGSSGSEFVSDNVEAYPASPIFAVSANDTLTGGTGGNNEFVFAQPIGNDTIYDFTAASDTIDLIGFGLLGYGSLAIADDANGNAVVTLGTGETITLKGVAASTLAAGNFVFDTEPTSTNAGTMTIGDGAILPLGGTIDNSGTIALGSTGDETSLEILVRGATLEGGGALTLTDNSQNVVFGGDPSAVLTNVDNTISGTGQLGQGQMTLDNEGTIDATGTNALVIDTGAHAVANAGTLEATGAGGLTIDSPLANAGTLWANGGNVTVEGAASGGGKAELTGAGNLEFAAASDAAVSFDAGATGTLKLDQSAAFSGTVTGFSGYMTIDLADIMSGAADTLGYAANPAGTGGTLSVSDGTHIANLALLGQYAAATDFAMAADSTGGTLVTLSDPTQNHLAVPPA